MTGPGLRDSFDLEHALLVASRSPLASVVERSATRSRIAPGPVMVAVSGGPDSTALLLLACALVARRTPPPFGEIFVGHVDHGLRAEGAGEAALVRSTCERLGVGFAMERLAWEIDAGVSSGDARDARWDALNRLAVRQGASTILCGHHADDQAETVLLRLARGTGLAGLAGIPEARDLPGGMRIVRPLLSVGRADLVGLVRAAGVPVVDDPTNDRADVARGLVRHEVMPRLESLHPGASGRIAALATEARAGGRGPDRASAARPPVSIRWSRAEFRVGDDPAVASLLRESIRAIPGVEPLVLDGIPRASWLGIARAILDHETRRRGFDLTGIGRLAVEARSVVVDLNESADDASSPTLSA